MFVVDPLGFPSSGVQGLFRVAVKFAMTRQELQELQNVCNRM